MYHQMNNGFNVGGTKIDARLESSVFIQGEPIKGQIHVQNSGYMQEVGDLYARIYAWLTEPGKGHHKGKTVEIAAYKLANSFTVQQNQQTSFPFQIQIPFNTPATTFGGTTRVWLRTTLDTYSNYDPTDDDYIEVRLSPLKERVLNAVQRVGLQLYKVDCENSEHHQGHYNQGHYGQQFGGQQFGNQQFGQQQFGQQFGQQNQQAFNSPNFNQPGHQNQMVNGLLISSNTRLVQEFEFRPVVHQYRGLDELEVVFNQWTPHDVQMIVQIDRKRKGFFSGDERTVTMNVNTYNFNEQNFMYELDATIKRWIHS